jgi:ubiquinone biosynthesis protein UbiJ
LTPNAGEVYLHLVSRYGSEVAAEIVRFTFENLKRMRDLAGMFAGEESEVVEVEKVRVFLKEFERFRRGVKALKRGLEEFRGVYTVLERGVLKVRFLCLVWNL